MTAIRILYDLSVAAGGVLTSAAILFAILSGRTLVFRTRPGLSVRFIQPETETAGSDPLGRESSEASGTPAPQQELVEGVSLPHCCPVCNGAGHTSRPPEIPGDVLSWTASTSATYRCRSCIGTGYVWSIGYAAEPTS